MSVGTCYAEHIPGNENLSGFLSEISLIPVLVCMPLVEPLNKKYGKRNVALVDSIISIIGQAAMLINPSSFGRHLAFYDCNARRVLLLQAGKDLFPGHDGAGAARTGRKTGINISI